jgi:YidC/Oxa1 family membrane protein insertase
MQKRLLLAIVLTVIVIIVSQKLFAPPPGALRVSADSSLIGEAGSTAANRPNAVDTGAKAVPDTTPMPAPVRSEVDSTLTTADSVTVVTPKAAYHFSTAGARPLNVVLHDYHVLPRGDQRVVLGRKAMSLLSYELIRGRDTVRLDHARFTPDTTIQAAGTPVGFNATVEGLQIGIVYSFAPSGYLASVHGSVKGDNPPSTLLIRLHRGLPFVEADSSEELHNFAYVVKPVRDDAHTIPFAKLDSLQPRVESDPLAWVASKNKYFLLAVISTTPGKPFTAGIFTRGLHEPKAVAAADALILQPLTANGEFSFDLYTGPQEFRRLHQLGHDLEHVNPYGGILRAFVQPFASMVMEVLLWIHDQLRINYGWVLIIFGVVVRLLLWPLNQGAMRNSLKLQRIQPQLQEIQKRYKGTPEKLQSEMGKLYRDHGMSPFTPLAGCLPMLIPMPVLFALYFVFQNTIEFRGVSFLWMPDLALRDPLFILPAVMGISMYLLSWISLRASPPNPQAKMMAYLFPVMMVVFFWRLAAGLNLYYAVQNLATLPQQWLIARERAKLTVVTKGG